MQTKNFCWKMQRQIKSKTQKKKTKNNFSKQGQQRKLEHVKADI